VLVSDAWSGYRNGQIPLDKMLKVEGNYFEPNVGHAVIAALAEVRRHGVSIHINEGYRPLGIPGDQKVTVETQTSTHSSNQWFQYGRMQRGETPTAAYPGGSIHGWGKALDVSPGRNNGFVKAVFEHHGFSFNIASEPWHASWFG
jgi:hypothetical protein